MSPWAPKEDALLDLIGEYQAEIAGFAVIPTWAGHGSTERFGYRLNAATNAAGVESLYIVTSELLPRVQQRLPATPIKRDFRVHRGMVERLQFIKLRGSTSL